MTGLISCNTRSTSTGVTWLNSCILNYIHGECCNHRYLQRMEVNYLVSFHTSSMTAVTRKTPSWRRSRSPSDKRAACQSHPVELLAIVPLHLKTSKDHDFSFWLVDQLICEGTGTEESTSYSSTTYSIQMISDLFNSNFWIGSLPYNQQYFSRECYHTYERAREKLQRQNEFELRI